MPQSPNSDTTTRNIRVQAAAKYAPEESDPERQLHTFVYRIRITNDGDSKVQLLSRHWIILDSNNRREEVVGDGVIGKQPELGPGEMHEYTSYCPLRTEWGTMEGTYTFRDENEDLFEVAIGRFFLVPTPDGASVSDAT